MDKEKLLNFLITARAATYAANSNKVPSVFPGGHQLEFKEGDFLYRDFYNMGNKIFVGLETVYFQNKPVWSNSYYGNFTKMTEQEVDKILRQALIKFSTKARLWQSIEWKSGNYRYVCNSDGNFDECSGTEEIYNGPEKLYFLYYAAAIIG